MGIADHAEFWEPRNPQSPICFRGRACSGNEEYFRLVGAAKERYKGRLAVLAGVEISYVSSHEEEIRQFLEESRFEYVIGSVHDSPPVDWWDPGSERLLRERPDLAREALKFYYSEIEKAAISRLFDIIAHIDIYERYLPRLWPDILKEEELAPAVRSAVEAVAANARMEVNLSTLRSLRCFPWSAQPLLSMYHELGGRPPTVGSDAHVAADVGKALDKAERLAREAGFGGAADWRDIVRYH